MLNSDKSPHVITCQTLKRKGKPVNMPREIGKKIVVALISLPTAVVAQPNHPISHDEIIGMLEDHKDKDHAHGDLRPVLDDLDTTVSRSESRIAGAESRISSAEAAIEALEQADQPIQRQSDGLGTIGTLVLSALSAVGGALLAAWALRRHFNRRRDRGAPDTRDQATPKPDDETSTEQTNEGERPMFRKLKIRTTGITGNTGYAVIDADNPKLVKELRETLRRIDDGEVSGRVRIQLRAGNHEAVATGMDTYDDVDEAWEQLENIHDDTLNSEVARINDSKKS